MTIFILNYIHVFIIAVLVILFLKNKSGRFRMLLVVMGIITLIGYQSYTPSHMPKGKVPVNAIAPFEKSNAVIEDRNKKPDLTKEEREERLDNLLDWREQVKTNKEKENEE